MKVRPDSVVAVETAAKKTALRKDGLAFRLGPGAKAFGKGLERKTRKTLLGPHPYNVWRIWETPILHQRWSYTMSLFLTVSQSI